MNFSLIILIMIHEYITLCGSSRQILNHQNKTSDWGGTSMTYSRKRSRNKILDKYCYLSCQPKLIYSITCTLYFSTDLAQINELCYPSSVGMTLAQHWWIPLLTGGVGLGEVCGGHTAHPPTYSKGFLQPSICRTTASPRLDWKSEWK